MKQLGIRHATDDKLGVFNYRRKFDVSVRIFNFDPVVNILISPVALVICNIFPF